jgi:hypothetical protein
MAMIPGTTDWVKAKAGQTPTVKPEEAKPVEKVTVTEEHKDNPVEVKADNQ